MSRSIMDYFTQLQGQNQAVEFLESAIKTSRLAPAYLFVGPSGIGKTLASNSFCPSYFDAKSVSREIQFY